VKLGVFCGTAWVRNSPRSGVKITVILGGMREKKQRLLGRYAESAALISEFYVRYLRTILNSSWRP
jgi:hypothetical protein